jgi:acetyl esterase/lipase
MDPELRAAYAGLPVFEDPALDWPATRRRVLETFGALLGGGPEPSATVKPTDATVPGPPDNPEGVRVRVYEPRKRNGPLPAILYVHGGGFTAGSIDLTDYACDHLVDHVDAVVVSVEYRLAPEHPFPAGPEDCYAALRWLFGSATELAVDAARIAVAGASAGGGIAAGVALMARDRGEVALAFQAPLYACIDDRHVTQSSHEITDPQTWNRQNSLDAWRAYLGHEPGGDVSPYAAPGRAEDLSSLPPAYMCVGQLDLVRDENVEYASRLLKAGVPTELHVYPGAFHGFEDVAPLARVSVDAIDDRDRALRRALHRAA